MVDKYSQAWELLFTKSLKSSDTVITGTGRDSEPHEKHGPERQHQLAVVWGHDQQDTCFGSEDITFHLQAPFQAG